jgi:hypothetical protein
MSFGGKKPGDRGHYFANEGILRHLSQSTWRSSGFLRDVSQLSQRKVAIGDALMRPIVRNRAGDV